MKLNIEKLKKGGSLSKSYIKEAHKKPGGSNVGKKTFADGSKRTGPYAGPSGGSPKGSYPILDVAHAKAAIKMSGHAPNPAGIKAAIYKKYPQLKKHQEGGVVKSNLPITNNPGELTGYNMFRETLPANQAINGKYDLFTGWKNYGKPLNFNSAIKSEWMTRQPDGYHANSVAYNNETGNYDFLKDKNHHTIAKELEFYNAPNNKEFRDQYDLDKSKDYYKYVPKKSIMEIDRSKQLYKKGGYLTHSGADDTSQDSNATVVGGKGKEIKKKKKYLKFQKPAGTLNKQEPPITSEAAQRNMLKNKGYVINGDVDFQLALEDYKKYSEYGTPGSCGVEGCAKYANKVDPGTYGHAWTNLNSLKETGAEVKYNIYENKTFKNWNEAFNYSKRNANLVDKSKLKVGDRVGLFYPTSTHHKEAFDTNSGTPNTHVGFVSDIVDGIPQISHNIHGTVHRQPYNKVNVVWVADPKKYNDVGIMKKAGAYLNSFFIKGGTLLYQNTDKQFKYLNKK